MKFLQKLLETNLQLAGGPMSRLNSEIQSRSCFYGNSYHLWFFNNLKLGLHI